MIKVKIKIANNAYNDMLNLLKFHDNYSCFRLYYEEGCCKSSKVQLMLDVPKPTDICDKIEDLTICYDGELSEKVEEVIVYLNNGNYLIKPTLKNLPSFHKDCSKSCSSCKNSCGGH